MNIDKQSNSFDVAIVGGGASGVIVAAHLLIRRANLRIALIEPNDVGVGIAYRTTSSAHLLNVRAGNMSFDPERPNHFLDWIKNQKLNYTGADFVPRMYYGRYLRDTLELERNTSASKLSTFKAQALSIVSKGDRGYLIPCSDEIEISAKYVVFCVGNLAPRMLPIPGLDQSCLEIIINDPWQPNVLKNIVEKKDLLLVGTGLTAIDVVTELDALGFKGSITLLSRRGQISQPHAESGNGDPANWKFDHRSTLRSLIRDFVTHVRQSPSTWRSQIDSLRSSTAKIWQSLSDAEQRRFMRHLRPFWDTHRHRVASHLSSRIQELQRAGQLAILAGRIENAIPKNSRLELVINRRSTSHNQKIVVDAIINCTGPSEDFKHSAPSIIQDAVQHGLISFDSLHMGMKVNSLGQAIDDKGGVTPGIFAVGPLRKGVLWESIAIPEIRVQAAELADHIR